MPQKHVTSSGGAPQRAAALLGLAANVVTIAAGFVAIVGIWVWIDEASERSEERAARASEQVARSEEAESRRQDRIGRALEILEDDSADGLVETRESPHTRWAIDVLAANDLPIEISAKQIRLDQLDLKCVRLKLRAEDVHLWESTLVNSEISAVADRVGFSVAGLTNVDLDVVPLKKTKTDVNVFGSELRRFRVSPWFMADPTLTTKGAEPDGFLFSSTHTRARDLSFYYNEKGFAFGLVGPDAELKFPDETCAEPEERWGSAKCVSRGDDAPPTFGEGALATTITIPEPSAECSLPEARPRFSRS